MPDNFSVNQISRRQVITAIGGGSGLFGLSAIMPSVFGKGLSANPESNAQPANHLPHGKSDGNASPPIEPPASTEPFVVLGYNSIAHRCGVLFAKGNTPYLSPLVIEGGIGMGKTHLLKDIGTRIHYQHPSLRIRYVTCDSFIFEMVQAIKDNQLVAFHKKYQSDTDCLLVDDISTLTDKIKSQETILRAFNCLSERGGRIAFSTTVPLSNIPGLIEPLRSRLLSGVITEIRTPTIEEKEILLRKICRQRGLDVNRTKLHELAATSDGKDIRVLTGELTRHHIFEKLRRNGTELFSG